MVRQLPDRFVTSARGASSAEYAILIACIAAVIIGAVAAFGGSVEDLFAFTLPDG